MSFKIVFIFLKHTLVIMPLLWLHQQMRGSGQRRYEETVCIQHSNKVPTTSKCLRGQQDGMVVVPNSDDFMSC